MGFIFVAVLGGAFATYLIINKTVYGPEAVIRNYVTAIAAGDAVTANRLVVPKTGAQTVLTPQAMAQAERITILGVKEFSDSKGVTVKVVYRLGNNEFVQTFQMSQGPRIWGIFDHWAPTTGMYVTYTVRVSGATQVGSLAVGGSTVRADPVSGAFAFTAYPGVYQATVNDGYFTSSPQPLTVTVGDDPLPVVPPTFTLTATQKAADEANTLIKSLVDTCITATVGNPPGCPIYNAANKGTWQLLTYPTVKITGTTYETVGGTARYRTTFYGARVVDVAIKGTGTLTIKNGVLTLVPHEDYPGT